MFFFFEIVYQSHPLKLNLKMRNLAWWSNGQTIFFLGGGVKYVVFIRTKKKIGVHKGQIIDQSNVNDFLFRKKILNFLNP